MPDLKRILSERMAVKKAMFYRFQFLTLTILIAGFPINICVFLEFFLLSQDSIHKTTIKTDENYMGVGE